MFQRRERTGLAGGHRCGNTGDGVDGDQLTHALRHCSGCRRHSGAPMVGWVLDPHGALKITRVAPEICESSQHGRRHSCGSCGTRLFDCNEHMLPGIVDIAATPHNTTLAATARIRIQVAERIAWMARAHGLPQLERFPPQRRRRRPTRGESTGQGSTEIRRGAIESRRFIRNLRRTATLGMVRTMHRVAGVFEDAVRCAQEHEVNWTRDPHAEPRRWGVHHDDPPPYNRLFGPIHPRGPASGVVWRHGRALARWGEPERADLTFSVAKTYLALLAGVAHGQGLLPDPDEPVVARLAGIGFDSPHNRSITWMHLLTQTSEWEGTCHGLPDTVDRYRKVAHDPKPVDGIKGTARPLQAPGSHWEYNDVRINQLSLALLHLFGRALPEVFRTALLDPLGASPAVRWAGYDQAWVDLPARDGYPGQRVQSVPGGTHWGGGVSISAMDQARIGELVLNRGKYHAPDGPRQLIPSSWIDRMGTPVAIAPFYGMLVWLNPAGTSFPGASERSVFMVGAGGNYVWIEPEHDAVIVVRWIDAAHFDEFSRRMTSALQRT